MGLLERVKATIRRHNLLDPGDGVVVGVSGGPDSVALLHVLYSLREEYDLRLRVVHVHHGLREEAEKEAELVEKLSSQWALPCSVYRIDLRTLAKEKKCSLQEAGRAIRYQLMEEEAERWGCTRIALGHQAEDQVETILEHFLRGSGLDGLAGMPYRRDKIIRPLLDVSRSEIEAYLAEHQLPWAMDASNLKPLYLRNRIRWELLPVLKDYNPNIVGTLLRMAEIIREEEAWLEEQAAQAEEGMVRVAGAPHGEERVMVSIEKLKLLPRALQRRLLRRAVARLSGTLEKIEFQHIEGLLELVYNPASGRVQHLPHCLQGRREYHTLYIERRQTRQALREWAYPVVIPGKTLIPEAGVVLEAQILSKREISLGSGGKNWVVLDYDRLSFPLWARKRKAGDRFLPAGLTKSKKLKDFFIDARVPREQRERTVIVASEKEIYWVAGYRADARFLASETTSRGLLLKVSTFADRA